MTKKRKPNRRKIKADKRKRRRLAMTESPTVTTSSDTETLTYAYPISVYWDNDENLYMGELEAFNLLVHGDSTATVISNIYDLQRLTITKYRELGYTLPSL